jgi:hypothetical protein
MPSILSSSPGLQNKGGKFCGDEQPFAGVSLHHRLAHGLLTFALMVDVRGVEVVEARSDEYIHHPVQRFVIEVRGAAFHRQTHHAEAKH